MSSSVFTPRDDNFHFDEMGDRWWMTETAWFSFFNAERKLGGWLYTYVRPNIGTVQGGCWIWDDQAHLPWEVLYNANYASQRLPPESSLTDIALPTGVRIKVVEPTRSYDLAYEDGDRIALNLRFDAIMDAHSLSGTGSAFGHNTHFDQLGHVHGTIELPGEEVAIDCIAMRDRSWGPRPEHRPITSAYVSGAFGTDRGFLMVTDPTTAGDPAKYGFLLVGGRARLLKSGNRTVDRDPETGNVSAIRMAGVDLDGRTLSVVGKPLSRIVLNRHTFITINSLVEWTDQDGCIGWGEDQDMWVVHDFAAFRRATRGRQGS